MRETIEYTCPLFGPCPSDIIKPLRWYARFGRPLSEFLSAVVAGDLHSAVALAGRRNGLSLAAIVSYLLNELPPQSYGSEATYRCWMERGGLEGQTE